MSPPPRISHRTWTMPDLLAEHRAGRLLLPVMQREWSWNGRQLDAFARSLIRGIPLGTFVLARQDRRREMFPTWPPPWCFPFPLTPTEPGRSTPMEGSEGLIVLDGRHRIEAMLRLRDSPEPFNRDLWVGGRAWGGLAPPTVGDVATAIYEAKWPLKRYFERTEQSTHNLLKDAGPEKIDLVNALYQTLDHTHLRAPMVHVVVIEDATPADWVETIRTYSRAGAAWTDAQLKELEEAAETFAPRP